MLFKGGAGSAVDSVIPALLAGLEARDATAAEQALEGLRVILGVRPQTLSSMVRCRADALPLRLRGALLSLAACTQRVRSAAACCVRYASHVHATHCVRLSCCAADTQAAAAAAAQRLCARHRLARRDCRWGLSTSASPTGCLPPFQDRSCKNLSVRI